MEPGSREPRLAILTGLLRAYMAKMDAQEAHRSQEYVQREHWFKALQHQFSLLQMKVQARTTPIPDPPLVGQKPLESPDHADAVSSRPLSLTLPSIQFNFI